MQTILPAQANLMLRRTLVIAMPIWFGVIGIVVLFRISDSLQHNRACREFACRAEEEGIGCWLFSLETTHRNMLIRPEELLRQIVPRYDWIEISGNGQRLSPEAEQRLRLLDGVRWISLSKVMITSSLASSLADIAELETVKIDLGCDLSQLQIDHVEEGVARLSEIRLDCRDSNDIAAFSQLSICRSVEAVFIRTSDPSSDVTKVLHPARL